MRGVTSVRLENFRSYRTLKLNCDPRPVVLTGSNGMGKTNLLEALSFLSPGRGLRSAKLSQIGYGLSTNSRPPWYVSVDLLDRGETTRLGTGYEGGRPGAKEKRLLKRDGEFLKTQADLSTSLSISWMTPQMDGLFQGPSSDRRRFLDRLIDTFDADHTRRLHRYAYALRERSQLLKKGIRDPRWLKTLEETMASAGVAIAYARREAIHLLSQASDWALGIFPQVSLRVVGTLETWMDQNLSALVVEENLYRALQASRDQDAEKGSAAEGPHRTDLEVRYKERAIDASFCSTGEQKALLLSLIMAAARVQSTHQRGVPLVLLDEVIAHLDETRRRALFEEIKNLTMQVWMTGTERTAFEGLQDDAQYFIVKHSHIDQCM